jgi:drug/metabolite transporter (DMT)-like permease
VVWRILVGSAVLLAVAFLRHGRAAIPRAADLPLLVVCSLLGVAINMVAFLEGLERTTAVEAGLLMPMIPVYTMAIAVAVRQEAFGLRRAAGLAVALAGAALLLLRPGQELAGGHLTGNLLIVGNTLSYALYLVASKPLLRRYPPLALIAWVFALSLWTIPIFYRGQPLMPPGAETASWLSLGYVLVFATLISYILNTFALSLVSASTTATYILLQPLITAAGGVLILGERLAPGTWQAAAAILAGVWLVVRSSARRPPPAIPAG